MDFSYSEDQDALRELARTILGDAATHERLGEIDASPDGIDRELWAELARANLVGACLPEEFGGMGLGIPDLCILLEEVGRVVAPVPLWATLALGALPIAAFGSAAQKQRWLPRVAAGDVMLTGALQEPDSEDPLVPSTRAEGDGAGWRLFGTKHCVPAAHLAARILVPARTADEMPVLFLIDPEVDGVQLERQRSTNREPVATLVLEGVSLAADDVLGDPESGAEALAWTLERAITGVCAMQLGVAERALRMTAEYTSERVQFDRPIGSFQAVHQRAADAYIHVEAMRLTLQQAAFRLAQGESAPTEVAVAKVWAADGGNHATYAAQHLHGGIGVDLDYPLYRSYLWTRHLELTLGSAAQHLERIGATLAG